jgi:hypothetical protein
VTVVIHGSKPLPRIQAQEKGPYGARTSLQDAPFSGPGGHRGGAPYEHGRSWHWRKLVVPPVEDRLVDKTRTTIEVAPAHPELVRARILTRVRSILE